MPAPIPCCVDVPSGERLLRYGLTELCRGLGLEPAWTRRDDARLVLATGPPATSPLPVGERAGVGQGQAEGERSAARARHLPLTPQALTDLAAPRLPAVADLGWAEIDGERWPVPVGPPGPSAAAGDLVAGAAWWLAGLQERAVEARDRHGRFPFSASLQAALGDAPGGPLRPAVDATRRWLAALLGTAGVEAPGRRWGRDPWAVALTHDLDAVRTRRLRAVAGSLRQGRPAEALRRGLGPDRRRASIDALRALAERHGTAATWFVKPGAWAPEDLPDGLDDWLVDRLRRWAEAGHEVGWHPGYGTLGRLDRLTTERARFKRAFKVPARIARTHFLRWDEAWTPGALAASGVRLDSTLGFAEHEGFRRGTAHPFPLFVDHGDGAGVLWEMPLAVMDTTLVDYRGLGADGQAEALDRVFAAARASGGAAVVLWHNQVGTDAAAWGQRLATLDGALGRARAAGARLGPLGALLESWHGGAFDHPMGATPDASRP